MDVPTDTVAPWTIKSIPLSVRDAVTKAARQEGLTVGQWLEKRVNEWIEDGGPVRVSPSSGQAVSTRVSSVRSDLEDLERLASMARALAPEGKDTQALRIARRVVADRLKRMDVSPG